MSRDHINTFSHQRQKFSVTVYIKTKIKKKITRQASALSTHLYHQNFQAKLKKNTEKTVKLRSEERIRHIDNVRARQRECKGQEMLFTICSCFCCCILACFPMKRVQTLDDKSLVCLLLNKQLIKIAATENMNELTAIKHLIAQFPNDYQQFRHC